MRAILTSLGLASCHLCCLDVQAQPGGTKIEEPKLPGSTRALGEYLPNTVWELKRGGIFRFRGDGTMVMPWHDFQWKTTGPRTAQMFTKDWRWEIKFSEDMKTLEVPGRYNATQVRRLMSAVSDKRLEEILPASPWERIAKDGTYGVIFAKHGKMMENKGWTSWEIHGGLLIMKGTREGKAIREEYIMKEDKKPYTLSLAGGNDSSPKLIQK
jgi:hypothetical protein